jgi:hypothetical protein
VLKCERKPRGPRGNGRNEETREEILKAEGATQHGNSCNKLMHTMN